MRSDCGRSPFVNCSCSHLSTSVQLSLILLIWFWSNQIHRYSIRLIWSWRNQILSVLWVSIPRSSRFWSVRTSNSISCHNTRCSLLLSSIVPTSISKTIRTSTEMLLILRWKTIRWEPSTQSYGTWLHIKTIWFPPSFSTETCLWSSQKEWTCVSCWAQTSSSSILKKRTGLLHTQTLKGWSCLILVLFSKS